MSTKGIVVSPHLRKVKGGVQFDVPSRIHPTYLRECALYWDLIDLPRQDRIDLPMELGEDVKLLEKEGMFIRSKIDFGEVKDTGFAPLTAQVYATRLHNQEGGTWTMGQNAQHLRLPKGQATKSRRAEVELVRAVPVPLAGVPMEEVLEFRSRRHDELMRYRKALSGLYQDIASSNDVPRTKTQKIKEVRESVADLNHVMHESNLERLMRTIKVELSLTDLAGAAVSTAATASFDLTAAVGVGAVSLLNLSIDVGDIIDPIPDDLKDFAYVSHVQDELGPDT